MVVDSYLHIPYEMLMGSHKEESQCGLFMLLIQNILFLQPVFSTCIFSPPLVYLQLLNLLMIIIDLGPRRLVLYPFYTHREWFDRSTNDCAFYAVSPKHI